VKPSAPELFASAGECAAVLEINDLSDNEEGFAVYRQTGMSPMWVKVATLSSQSEWTWITYFDEGIYGAVSYYVTAFNSKGEVKSNFVMVSIDPTDCASDSKRASVGTVEVALQIPNLKGDKAYCYMSTDGMNWARWPMLGFLTPDEEDSYELTNVLVTSYNVGGSGQSEDVPMDDFSLFIECWGWEGSELQYLGKLGKEGISPQENGSQNIMGEGIVAEVVYEINKLPDLGYFYPMGLENNWVGDSQTGSGINLVKDVFLHMGAITGTSPEIPRVYLDQTTDREICGQHLPPDAQNIFGQLLYCFPYPAYDPDKGGATDQPYLVWDFDFFEPNCIGSMSEECKTYWELLELAEETGGQVGFTITSLRGGIKNVWNVTEPDLTMFVVPPLPCIGGAEYSVRMWYQPGNEGVGVSASPGDQISKIGEGGLSPAEVHYGPYSNWVTIPCNSSNIPTATIIEQIQYVEIDFQTLSFSGLDDGDKDNNEFVSDAQTQDVELYGYFRVKAPAMGHWEEEPCMFGGCDDEEPFWAGTRRYLLVTDWEEDENLFVVKEGSPGDYGSAFFYLDSEKLCPSTTKYSCTYEGQDVSYDYDNNFLRVFVKEGDALTFDVMLVDYDELSDDDVVCVGTKMTPSKSLSEWSSIDDAQFTIYGESTDSGSCTVVITVTAVMGPWNYNWGH
jgi:hypothetical protein